MTSATVFVDIPTLHADQVRAYEVYRNNRFVVGRCGRRWGKTEFAKTIAADLCIRGKRVGWFAPEYKKLIPPYDELEEILEPLHPRTNRGHLLQTKVGNARGHIDFWSLENEHAGRGRKYDLAIIDEAAFTKENMKDVWERAIAPTLLDYRGKCLVISNTNGVDDTNFLYQICHEERFGFVEFHAPTHANPLLPKEELDELIKKYPPLVYKQEYLAEFVDWSGVAFFDVDSLLEQGKPLDKVKNCDLVFAVMDTATKTGKEHDGTAVQYFAYNKHVAPNLVIVDWDIVQIEGDLLESWMPNVYRRLEELSAECGARRGSIGAFVEDKSSGMVLLQAGKRRNWKMHPIDSKLTSLGKDERAISVSGYVYRRMVKITKHAYDKVSQYKTYTRNHLIKQVTAFRVGGKGDGEDDLLDTFCYGIAIALGNIGGW